MRAARDGGILVPEVFGQTVSHDLPVLLLSWCSGQLSKARFSANLGVPINAALLSGRMLARIHRIFAPPILLEEGRSWLRWKPSSESMSDKQPEKARDSNQLLHLDYHPLNVMIDGGRISGVLDCANASYGDPRADVARTVTILRLDIAILATPRALRLPVKTLVRAFESGWRAGYEEVGGPLGDLSDFYAWAGEVMQRDLAHRYSTDQLQPVRDWTEHWRLIARANA
jgi:Phosphotransferase enzyme family